jgi:hypothetical protein
LIVNGLTFESLFLFGREGIHPPSDTLHAPFRRDFPRQRMAGQEKRTHEAEADRVDGAGTGLDEDVSHRIQ